MILEGKTLHFPKDFQAGAFFQKFINVSCYVVVTPALVLAS